MFDLIRNKLAAHWQPSPYFFNTAWLIADKVMRAIIGLVMTIWLARYFGPEKFGLWNFALAITALFGIVAALGLDNIVVRELVKNPDLRDRLLVSALLLKLLGGVFAFALAVLVTVMIRAGESEAQWLVGVIAAGFVLQPLTVIHLHFQAIVQSKFVVIAAGLAYLVVTVVKILLFLGAASLLAFAWAGLAEILLSGLFSWIAYLQQQGRLTSWRFDRKVATRLLSDSWPLLLSGLSVLIYMRIDQLMIAQMLGNEQLGFYSAAVRISEVYYFIPMVVSSSFFPLLIKNKTIDKEIYLAQLQKLLSQLVWLAIGFAVTVSLFHKIIIYLLYGEDYSASATVLLIHTWTAVFVVLGVVSGSWLIAENLQKISFYRTLAGGIVNIVLNYLLIPIYGINGAAFATLISQVVAAWLFDLINHRTRPIFWMKLKSLNPLHLV